MKTQYTLNKKQWLEFLKFLDEPPKENDGFKRLMTTKAPWEKDDEAK